MELLRKAFPKFEGELQNEKRRFDFISTIDIDMAFKFKHKGFTRNIGGIFKDLSELNLSDLWLRFLVVFGLHKDPYDVYDRLIMLRKKYDIRTLFFFLLGEYGTYDKNISPGNSNYRLLIKNIADYCTVGIHPSYYSMKKEQKMKKEMSMLKDIVNFPITKSRQHYLRVELPETYQHLVDLEIKQDYSMGYASHYGFRPVPAPRFTSTTSILKSRHPSRCSHLLPWM